ncbi:MAG TPA: fumarylacetoacetase [Terriglobales bacterium]|nr:fumarylacetoacetase [Terriglobales bacterium]
MKAASWVVAANQPDSDFPLENLPYGGFAMGGRIHLGVAIGDQILDLNAAADQGVFAALPEPLRGACRAEALNQLLELGPAMHARLRAALTACLAADAPGRERTAACLRPIEGVALKLAFTIGDYTDFYASIDHARNVGARFRPDNPLLPNYAYVPIGYHGRSSSIGVSPAEVRRPQGQQSPQGSATAPGFGPAQQLDYEVEIAAVIGRGNSLGEPIPMAAAEDHLFGLCLLNDWSARDIQRWEYQPLGPFLGKNFATTLSPWVVTMAALEPFRVPARPRGAGEPQPLAYLSSAADQKVGGFDITVEAYLSSRAMREHSMEPVRLSQANVKNLYWTLAQLVTHHTSNGCNLRSGDLLGSGTLSGPTPGERGCLLELATPQQPVVLPSGEKRQFLDDGDEVILRAYCQRPDGLRLGWGECRGTVLPTARN